MISSDDDDDDDGDQIIGSCPMLDRRQAVPHATDPAPAIPTRNDDRGDVVVDAVDAPPTPPSRPDEE